MAALSDLTVYIDRSTRAVKKRETHNREGSSLTLHLQSQDRRQNPSRNDSSLSPHCLPTFGLAWYISDPMQKAVEIGVIIRETPLAPERILALIGQARQD
jgi:hypothetical protein